MTPTEALETLRTIADIETDDAPWVYADANTLSQIADAFAPIIRNLSRAALGDTR